MAQGSSSAMESSAIASRGIRTTVLRWSGRNARLVAPLITLVAEIVFFSLITDTFLTVRNMQNVVTQVGPVAVTAAGITFVLLCAEIDLSIASVATLAGIIGVYFWSAEFQGWGNWGLLIGVAVAIACGLANGYFVAYIGIPSFMMTLAMLTIAQGLAVYTNDGKPIFKAPEIIRTLGGAGSRVGGFPVVGLVGLGALLIGEFILSYTKFGRYVYMTGGNREAAEMSGVNTRRVVMIVLTISGLTAGVTGLLQVGRLSSATLDGNANLLIGAIAAVVLGGTSLFGGEGSMRNTLLGLLIFGFLSNGLNLIPELSIYFKQALQGIVLVGALLLNVLALRLEKVQTRTE